MTDRFAPKFTKNLIGFTAFDLVKKNVKYCGISTIFKSHFKIIDNLINNINTTPSF